MISQTIIRANCGNVASATARGASFRTNSPEAARVLAGFLTARAQQCARAFYSYLPGKPKSADKPGAARVRNSRAGWLA